MTDDYKKFKEFQKMKKKQKRFDNISITNYAVFISLGSVFTYTVVVMYMYYAHGIEPVALDGYVFAFFGTEILALATIKVSSTIFKKKKEEICLEEEEEGEY